MRLTDEENSEADTQFQSLRTLPPVFLKTAQIQHPLWNRPYDLGLKAPLENLRPRRSSLILALLSSTSFPDIPSPHSFFERQWGGAGKRGERES